MKVEEAFKKHSYIFVDYVFIDQCRECGKCWEEIDEEYSFEGTIDDLTGWYAKSYGAITLDSELEQVKENHYKCYVDAIYEEICEECQEK